MKTLEEQLILFTWESACGLQEVLVCLTEGSYTSRYEHGTNRNTFNSCFCFPLMVTTRHWHHPSLLPNRDRASVWISVGRGRALFESKTRNLQLEYCPLLWHPACILLTPRLGRLLSSSPAKPLTWSSSFHPAWIKPSMCNTEERVPALQVAHSIPPNPGGETHICRRSTAPVCKVSRKEYRWITGNIGTDGPGDESWVTPVFSSDGRTRKPVSFVKMCKFFIKAREALTIIYYHKLGKMLPLRTMLSQTFQ